MSPKKYFLKIEDLYEGGCIYYVVGAYKSNVRHLKKGSPPDCTKKASHTPLATGKSTTNFVIYNAVLVAHPLVC